MKPIITALAIAGLATFSACNRDAVREKDAALQAQQRTIDSMNGELAKKRVIDSMNEVARIQYVIPESLATATVAPAAIAPAVASTQPRSSGTRRRSSGRSRSTSGASSSSNNGTVAQAPVYQAPPAAPQKRGWSAKAKGAVIGAGTGAAAGAIINKRNRAAGAVIGGVLGAGVGTGVGAVIDKKNGR